MQESLLYLGYIGIILLIGLVSSIFSRKLRIPNLLLLILLGMVLSKITFNGAQIINFSPLFLTSLAIITLALVVFDSSSKFKFREFDSMSASALKLSLLFLFLNMVLLTALTHFLIKPGSILLSLIFAAAVSGTDPSSTLMILSTAKSKLFELLKVEAILNTPLIVLIPFLLIDILNETGVGTLSVLSENIVPFAQQFVAGIGTGILVALIFFRFMKKYYSQTLSPLAIVTAAILTYIGAESLGGNGVLAVTAAGLFFGNVYKVKHAQKLQEFGEIFSEVLEILVFVLIGFMIEMPRSPSFLAYSFLLFLFYLGIRFVSVMLITNSNYTLKEKLYLTLNIPKGIAVAVVIFTLATQSIVGLKPILDLIFMFMIYSIVLSTVVTHFTKYFTKIEIKVDEKQ